MKNVLALVFAVMLLSGCLLDKKIDASSEEKMQESIQSVMEKMTEAEKQAFSDSLKIIMFADVKDFGDILSLSKEPDALQAAFKARINGKTAEEVRSLADEIRQSKNSGKPVNKSAVEAIKDEGKKDALKEMVSAKLISKELIDGRYTKSIAIEIEFTNNSKDDIKGVKGTTIFKDIFGDIIYRVNLSLDESIKAGDKILYTGSFDFNQFEDGHKKLASTDFDKIIFEFIPETILLTNGTKVQ